MGGPQSSADSAGITVPAHTLDPVSSLCPWPLVVSLSGRDFEIPALPAADWLRVLMDEEATTDDLLLAFLPEAVGLLFDESLELTEFGHDLIELAAGRRWYIALRMIHVVKRHWNVLGAAMLRKGVDPSRLSLSGWLDIALVTLIDHVRKEDLTMLLLQIEQPPLGMEDVEEEVEMSVDQFRSLMS